MFLKPFQRLQSFLTRRPTDYEDILDHLLEIYGYIEPEPMLKRDQAVVAPSTDYNKIWEPDDAETEWRILAVTSFDVTAVSPTTDIFIHSWGIYNTPTAITGIDLGGGLGDSFLSDWQSDRVYRWPQFYWTDGLKYNGQLVPFHNSGLRVYRKPNKDHYAVMSTRWITSATVGNRTLRTDVLYQSRPRLH